MAFNITDFSNKWANFKEELIGYFNNRAVDKNGDIMKGSLILARNPEESMEAVTKEFLEYALTQNNTFRPGDLRQITFGALRITGFQIQYSALSDLPDVEIVSSHEPFSQTAIPYANGSVKSALTIPQLSYSADYYNGAKWVQVDYANYFPYICLSLQIILIPDGETEIPIWTEKNITLHYGGMPADSIFGASQKIELDNIPIKIGVKPAIKLKTIIHDMAPGTYSQDSRITINTRDLTFTASVANPLCDTSA